MWVPDFILKMVGRDVAKKLDLQEGAMDTKPWYQSKTIWAAVVSGLIGLYNGVAAAKGLPPVPEWTYTLLGAVGVYSRATSTTVIG